MYISCKTDRSIIQRKIKKYYFTRFQIQTRLLLTYGMKWGSCKNIQNGLICVLFITSPTTCCSTGIQYTSTEVAYWVMFVKFEGMNSLICKKKRLAAIERSFSSPSLLLLLISLLLISLLASFSYILLKLSICIVPTCSVSERLANVWRCFQAGTATINHAADLLHRALLYVPSIWGATSAWDLKLHGAFQRIRRGRCCHAISRSNT